MKHTLLSLSFSALVSGLCLAASPVDSVNLFIGTGPSDVVEGVPGGKGGGTQPGAVVPFGMVNFGPDTDKPEQSGYDDTNHFIRGLSLTHLSGPGCRNAGELPVLPVSATTTSWPNPGHGFKKENQKASPGSYAVTFDNGISAELTATERTGLARFTFTDSSGMSVLLSTARNGVGNTQGSLRQIDAYTLQGKVRGGDFCAAKNFYDVYFVVTFDLPIKEFLYTKGVAKVSFDNTTSKQVLMRAGISYVSEDGAIKNLKTELPQTNFDDVRAAARSKWEKALGTININGGVSEEERILFYTSLYRALLHPNLASDVDGSYLGFDNQVHSDSTHEHYQNFSGWDIYRSQVQLLALLFPKRASDIAQSYLDAGAQCGALPKWGYNNAETAIMVGDPGSIILANMKAFGATDFDQPKALELMLKSAFDPSANCQGKIARPGLKEYMSLGYIPEPLNGVWGPAATTLEYTSADFAVAQFSKGLGKLAESSLLLQRAKNWKNLFDPSTKLIRPRGVDGNFISNFDPTSLTGFVEGNAYQYTWMIPYDGQNLIESLGGPMSAMGKLDQHLTELNGGLRTPYLYIGNEPCFNTPWMYLWAMAPHRTQESVRRLLVEEFHNSPGGLPGNDDLGALGSFYVWSSMGLFPSIPGVGGLSVGSPAFSSITISPEGSSKIIHIEAPQTESSIYVAGVTLDGKTLDRTWISFEEFMQTETLSFSMSSLVQSWGTTPETAPPAFID